MSQAWQRGWTATLAAVTLLGASAAAESKTLILVRHAEKAAEPVDDPPLTAAGKARAEALAQMLAGARIDLVITSTLRRTGDTAAPLVIVRHPRVKAVAIADVSAHVAAVVALVKAMPRNATILIVGHSNTVPMIAAALGVAAPPPIPECAFDRVFVLTLGRSPADLVAARYGAASPGCG